MNDWTLRQSWAYVQAKVSCPDCSWLLMAMVGEHDAAKGFAHPGVERLGVLCQRSWPWVRNHLRECVADGHLVLVKRWPKPTRRADEYAIPWLDNPTAPVQKRTSKHTPYAVQKRTGSAPRNRGAQRGAQRGTSSSSKEEESADAAAFRGGSVVDASKPVDTPPHSYPCSCPECTAAIEAKTAGDPNGDTPAEQTADNVRPLRAKRKR